jgi:hypothetical protein
MISKPSKDKLLESTMKSLLVEKMTEEKQTKLKEYHEKMSRCYGIRVGLAEEQKTSSVL